jgi:hypothetical protein
VRPLIRYSEAGWWSGTLLLSYSGHFPSSEFSSSF